MKEHTATDRPCNAENSAVVVLGDGEAASLAAKSILESGRKVILAWNQDSDQPGLDDDPNLEKMAHARVVECQGGPGEYILKLEKEGEVLFRRAAGILVTGSSTSQADYEQYGLEPGEFAGSLDMALEDPEQWKGKTLVFLGGLNRESEPGVHEKMLRAALGVQGLEGSRVLVLCKHLKVAAPGLESLQRDFKRAGGLIFKFSKELPKISQDDHGRVSLEFKEESTRREMAFSPDFVFVQYLPLPDSSLACIAEKLGLETDEDGYLQTGNVHRLPVSTNRAGVFVAGPARAVGTREQDETEAVLAAAGVLCQKIDASLNDRRAVIDGKSCIRCLTCFRVCPHKAVDKNGSRMSVMGQSCQACGICAAECPRIAISMEPKWLVETPPEKETAIREGLFHPALAVFVCENSAAIAATAQRQGLWPEQTRVVSMPCLGGLSLAAIMDAMDRGHADGVLLLACHEGNCHSGQGSHRARKRVEMAQDLLEAAGLKRQRIVYKSLAANMEAVMRQYVEEFSQSIQALGPIFG